METDFDLEPLSITEINEKLAQLPGWFFVNDKISKQFVFPSFKEAVEFVSHLALFCDKVDHHPDIHIYYKKIVFESQRFSVGGKVTERDFTVAKEIERLFSNINK